MDRAALDVALELGIECGGWVPRGRRAEDGPIDSRYPVSETDSDDYETRTALNVADADATLIITTGSPTGGTLLTLQLAEEMHRPHFVADPDDPDAAEMIAAWGRELDIGTLNVAGPRESGQPGIGVASAALLRAVFGED